ncbi:MULTISPECIES: hypothetical protein [unclassified Streptomyces]|uniref:hypothetical protein n=1 Tax=unclassified Streptomyces TaxID=2593676 RepID=UPI000BACB981|nr:MULTISPECIES: hypothetical protein [unclassified Streptomyces]ASY36733.1 hypothetical protein CAC01_15495 [Streptomyces sp. CLI2509]MYX18827.1 hypothetical protein [Streptomyces sp. SID8380]
MTGENPQTKHSRDAVAASASAPGTDNAPVAATASEKADAALSAAGAKTEEATEAARARARAAGAAGKRVEAKARTGVDAGRRKVSEVSEKAVASAGTAWGTVREHKVAAASAGAGLLTVATASFLAGRKSGVRAVGPLTRLTGGKL